MTGMVIGVSRSIMAWCIILLSIIASGSPQAQVATGLNMTAWTIPTNTLPSRCATCYTLLRTTTVDGLNHDFGGGGVFGTGRGDYVMVRLTGHIFIPGSGQRTITFYNSADDGFHMSINNTQVINNWVLQGASMYNGSGSITLEAGRSYPIDIWWYEWGGAASLRLYWNSTGSTELVPASVLYVAAPTPPVTITQSQSSRILQRRSEMASQSAGVHIDQIGSFNTIDVQQNGSRSLVQGVTGQVAPVHGTGNSLLITQGSNNPQRTDLSINGNANILNIRQASVAHGQFMTTDGGWHYQLHDITGSANTVTVQQLGTGGAPGEGQHVENRITGNSNAINILQSGGPGKSVFNTLVGNSSTVSVLQQGQGAHYLQLIGQGSGHSVVVNQSGSAGHLASVEITNGGGPVNVEIIQGGASPQNASVVQSCAVLAGCSVRISQ